MEEDFNTYAYTSNYNLPYPNNDQEDIYLIENLKKLAEATDTALDGKADTSDIPDLTNYVTNTDYATSSVGGVIKASDTNGFGVTSSGYAQGTTKTYSQYESAGNNLIISKGTLENVLTGKGLAPNDVTDVQINGTSILSSKVANIVTNTAYNASTNKIATMTDIVNYVNSLNGNGVSY